MKVYINELIPRQFFFDTNYFWASEVSKNQVFKSQFFSYSHASNQSHSQMEQYFFSYLLTWEVDLIEILEIMAQMWQYINFLSLKATKVTSDFILYYLKKVVGGATTHKY